MIAHEPFNEFISTKDAAVLLGITKRAFRKNSRIIRGFILSAEKDGRKYYLKRSVEQFKLSDDGRINLDSYNFRCTKTATGDQGSITL